MPRLRYLRFASVLAGTAALAFAFPLAQAPSTIDATSRFSWGENVGWLDWRSGGTASGAVFNNENFASGSIWSPNIGWISLGSGVPAVGHAYSNASGSDYGVNIDGVSDPNYYRLSGLAWSANCGWISFNATDPASRPRIERATGILRGYAWGANIGWLALDAPGVIVKTGPLGRNASDGRWRLYR